MVIAINIKTDLWNKVIELLIKDNWTVKYKYDGFDAGIDSDLLILKKNNEEILFGWDNWFEGEIKCDENRMNEIERLIGVELKKGEPINLKPEVIQTYNIDGLWAKVKRLFK